MVRDLDYRLGGCIGNILADARQRPDEIYFVGVELKSKEEGRLTHFFSRGDFREDVIEVARELVKDCTKYNSPRKFPQIWEKKLLFEKKKKYSLSFRGLELNIGAYDFKRVAKLAENSWATDVTHDQEGNEILTREQFLLNFRGAYVDAIINGNHHGTLSRMIQPPNDKQLAEILDKAGELFDKYLAIPVNSLLITKDFIFPWVMGRKKYSDFRWKSEKYCNYSKTYGARIPTADPCVHLTGVDKDCAPHMFKNPVFRANFSFPMDFIQASFVLPKEEEKCFVKQTIDSMDKFKTIWVQGAPLDLPTDITPVNRGGDWYPKKEEFIKSINEYLGIKQ